MPHTPTRRAARRLALTAAVLAAAAARPAAAQTVSVNYAPVCGSTACSTLRFTLFNAGTSALALNTLGFTGAGGAFAFTPVNAGAPTVGTFGGQDSFGPLGGASTIGGSGSSLFINFLTDAGFPFELTAGARGFVDVRVASGAGSLASAGFRFTAGAAGGTTVTGDVAAPTAVVPEPGTVILVAGGLVGLAAAARRRRIA